jgi:peroxiredoxin
MLLGISKYDAAETASWLEANPWTFPLLSEGSDVIVRYGLRNPAMDGRPDRAGLPHPATIIVDKNGLVSFVNVWEDYKKRTTPAAILEALDKVDEKD